ncbi:MAG: carbamoyl-phosphate synthase small subunit [Candidatus Methanomethylicota archaeon]|uniref:Carbamoyl phosphate synthase small chain n=1 Tax=Thermoproteota archaeon TaxID=2056631 RepID=A0A497F1J5_9CREN|nr:MAG: carbamoyl-phosphate synthase small subunit [Candidatus Verstraetearchaeota archaeon]RLE52798.1 MAG: carbamoyl-phosphate synthase small subunit [Candidatus Verstraetearchaeota archaeon]
MSIKAVLVLEDGSVWYGKGFGAVREVVGEVVFTTGMVGYPEALTDPSYYGQILTFTYPLIGNYGVPPYDMVDEFKLPLHFESHGVKVWGVVVHEVCQHPSHWSSVKSLHEWLLEENVPGIYGIDTRALTYKLRERGVMMGLLKVYHEGEDIDEEKLYQKLAKATRYGEEDLVKYVTVKEPIVHRPKKTVARIVLMDCGVKLGIIRELLKRGLEVIRVPYDTDVSQVLELKPQGVLVSNGPGDPKKLDKTIETVRELMKLNMPVFGICLGNQILALAAGGDTYKMKYGHRGQNKPCIDLTTGRSYVTSQNHGYAVKPEGLKDLGFRVWFINADDKTVEGIAHLNKPVFATQFHPEASPGPYDTLWVFDLFVKEVLKSG